MHNTPTARQRIDALLAADFYASDRGTVATRRDVLDALPTGPALDRYMPAPVTLPAMPETWRAVQ